MKKILIVDDSPFIRMVLRDIVSRVGAKEDHRIIEADTGTEAVRLVKKERPDLVLLDIIMPEGETEGVNVLKIISENLPNTKVVMITAVGHDAMIERCRKLGVSDYIVKPFDDNQIIEILKKYL